MKKMKNLLGQTNLVSNGLPLLLPVPIFRSNPNPYPYTFNFTTSVLQM